MSVQQQAGGKIRVGFRQAAGMLWPYVQSRFLAQVKVVALIITYLIAFQALVLGIPVAQAALIAAGLHLVIVGLTFFMSSVPEPMSEAAFFAQKNRPAALSLFNDRQQVAGIAEALERAGAFDEKTHGILYGRSVPKAFTYLGIG